MQLVTLTYMWPIFTVDEPDKTSSEASQNMFGRTGVIVLHAMSAFVFAPIMAEWMLTQTILFLSFYWLVFVWVILVFVCCSSFHSNR